MLIIRSGHIIGKYIFSFPIRTSYRIRKCLFKLSSHSCRSSPLKTPVFHQTLHNINMEKTKLNPSFRIGYVSKIFFIFSCMLLKSWSSPRVFVTTTKKPVFNIPYVYTIRILFYYIYAT